MLWFAPSAVLWEQAFVRLQISAQGKVPSIIKCIANPSTTRLFPQTCDRGFASQAQVYAIASLVRAFKHTQALFATNDPALIRSALIAHRSLDTNCSVIVYNRWAIAHSSSEYEQPDRFWPDRFLNDDLDKPTKGHLGFGTGRRVGVGYNLGVSNMFIALARLLSCFEFEPVPSAPIDLSSPRILSGSIEKARFEVKIKVRK
ncbi:hypothetical protein EAF00_004889 [Botryotinia globosa]|nr:hypothetical protein EAF00_004889 [Botryotinia globosa]